ncbi:MAG TPA: hypothetical protein VL426_01680 [Candidatus Binatia bacterium]|jgi:hypothetical protein|nr:hypothetical protein [Candidatus Binatia bacterium]
MHNNEHGTGALPPPDFAWQMGKTAASIRFVNEAMAIISVCGADDPDRQLLTEAVDAVKRGERVLRRFLDVEVFLVSGFPFPWEEGKTEASLRFVREAERYVADGRADAGARQMLGEAVDAVKNGERVLTQPLEIETFLVSGFPL